MAKTLNPIFNSIDSFFFDCDGVLWEGDSVFTYTKKIIAFLQSLKKKIFFISNNSTQSVEQYKMKFKNFGINISSYQIMISSFATVKYIQSLNNNIKNVFIVGEEGLISSFESAGFNVFNRQKNFNNYREIEAVIVGMDRTITYDKLTTAIRSIDRGALFIGTNPDPTFPTGDGIAPGAGSIIGAIARALNKEPKKICGKPDPLMANLLIENKNLGISKEKTVMIGDRVTTDMIFASNAEIKGILVKNTGFGSEELKKFPSFPFYSILNDISDIMI
ncbi:MAG: HAD-IIA family hydrolase [Candidatus Thorarchaeota archaeon]